MYLGYYNEIDTLFLNSDDYINGIVESIKSYYNIKE